LQKLVEGLAETLAKVSGLAIIGLAIERMVNKLTKKVSGLAISEKRKNYRVATWLVITVSHRVYVGSFAQNSIALNLFRDRFK
jgi:hypothetical protein